MGIFVAHAIESEGKQNPSAKRIPEATRINKDLLYKEKTCPSSLGFLKRTPIRKGLRLQGKEVNLCQGTHN